MHAPRRPRFLGCVLGVASLAASAGLALNPPTAGAATVSTGAATVSAGVASGSAVHATVASATGASTTGTPAPAFGNQYYLASRMGAVWPLGGAPDYGSLAGKKLDQPIVGITTTPDGAGYWMVASDGGVFGFGDAAFHGSTGGLRLDQPVVGLTPTPDGRGYWMYAGDGGIFAFGDAGFFGSTGGIKLQKPIVGMAATPDGHGYWLFAGDGGIFAFGDARFHGSTANLRLAAPVVSMASTADAKGYWLQSSDGGVFSFGDAAFHGSLSATGQVVARIVGDQQGTGYWEVTHSGDVYPFGSAASHSIPRLALLHTILGPADQAMERAMAQIGKPYQWGGTGPNAFDCSGLVMSAWQAAGVTIPRVAADQYNYGTHVAISQLQIGDLVFWAANPAQPSTIEHVAMYIGGEHMVDAPHTGTVVQTDWIGGPGFVAMGSRP
jgi:cell wall-associated NlpC family hydrolase